MLNLDSEDWGEVFIGKPHCGVSRTALSDPAPFHPTCSFSSVIKDRMAAHMISLSSFAVLSIHYLVP